MNSEMSEMSEMSEVDGASEYDVIEIETESEENVVST